MISKLARRLALPADRLSLPALAERWFVQSIEARLPMLGALADRWDVLPKIRGAWGRALMTGASAAALKGQSCTFDPPCALDVFFREQARQGRQGVAKPFVLEADRSNLDLIVRLKVFGFAVDWTPIAAERLVEALNERIDWPGLIGSPNLKSPKVADLKIRTIQGLTIGPAPLEAKIQMIAPFEDGMAALQDEPWRFLAKAGMRLGGLSPWHDAELDVDWSALAEAWRSINYDLSACRAVAVGRASRGRRFSEDCVTGQIDLQGQLETIWPLLMIAETTGAGRGATQGLGRFRVRAASLSETADDLFASKPFHPELETDRALDSSNI